MPAPSTEDTAAFAAVLARLDTALPPQVCATLRPPARAEDLAALAALLPEGARLPADLQALLAWHDGQSWNAPLSTKNNRRLLSAGEIRSELAYFSDPRSDVMAPWSASWLPVLTNDAGDFVVLETVGPQAGFLRLYWHDDPSRSVAHPSLLKWAEALLGEYLPPPAG